MILRPQRNFTVVRQIANHTDTDTYYVRAVIRDAYTDDILDTLNLTDQTGQRFTKNWQVAPDPSGLGREISIVTSVYTDSGYTTKSENYGDEENSHMIEERESGLRGGGNGGVDARTIRRIIREEIVADKEEEKKTPENKPEKQEAPKIVINLKEVLSAVKDLERKLKPEKAKPVDFSPVFAGLDQIGRMIEEKEVTPETDLSPVISKIEEGHENGELTREEMVGLLNGLEEAITSQLPKVIAALLSQATFQIAPTTAKVKLPEAEKKEDAVPFDINQLAL